MCVPRRWHTHGAKLEQHAGGTHVGHCGNTQVAEMAHVCATQMAHTHTHGANCGSTQVPQMAQCVCHASGTHMAQAGAARRWRTHAADWGQHAGGTNSACVRLAGGTDRGANWGSLQVAQMERVCDMARTGAAVRWHTYAANWRSTQVAQMTHVCATHVAHTWRKLGPHAGGAPGACMCHAGGTHMAPPGAARRRHRWPTCAPRSWHTHGANSGSTQVAQLVHVCAIQVAHTHGAN